MRERKEKLGDERYNTKRRSRRRAPPSSIGKAYHKTPRDKISFAQAFKAELKIHGDCEYSLWQAIANLKEGRKDDTIRNWTTGHTAPRWKTSLAILHRIESHYGLKHGHFENILFPDSALIRAVRSVNLSQQHVMRWHLPDNFDSLKPSKQKEILGWVHANVMAGATEYGKFMRTATRSRYSLRFSAAIDPRSLKPLPHRYAKYAGGDDKSSVGPRAMSRLVDAPQRLSAEIAELVRFKTSILAPPRFRRFSAWGAYSAERTLRHFGILFGTLVAAPGSSIKGLSPEHLTLAMLIFPTVWDWLLDWRHARRGFLTVFERHLMQIMLSLTRPETGWLRQRPKLSKRLRPIRGFISKRDIIAARSDWHSVCDKAHSYFKQRVREIRRIERVHRDPFEAIRVVLQRRKPLAVYRKIGTEILRHMPSEATDPLAKAETVRSYLMFRFAIHLGLRQRNLRELLLCAGERRPKSAFELESRGCGELRWSKQDRGWEVFIPAEAFKNSYSSFFRTGPFRVILPNLENLYDFIESYLKRDRPQLLRGYRDPGTFFVRTVRRGVGPAEYDGSGFYATWRLMIQRFGIYNPYTGYGAIEGLLPHGPHNVRDVLATHIIKQTGSCELASFAIHDTPEVTRQHYCRFLPEEKSAMAARIVNTVWKRRRVSIW